MNCHKLSWNGMKCHESSWIVMSCTDFLLIVTEKFLKYTYISELIKKMPHLVSPHWCKGLYIYYVILIFSFWNDPPFPPYCHQLSYFATHTPCPFAQAVRLSYFQSHCNITISDFCTGSCSVYSQVVFRFKYLPSYFSFW